MLGQSTEDDPTMEGLDREPILGEPFKVKAATEPTNIIWENRHIRNFRLCRRAFAAVLVVTFVLAISFAVIYAFKQISIKLDSKFPEVDCNKIRESFTEKEF